MQKYKKMIQTFKTKTNTIVISGILLSIRATDAFYDKAFCTNNCLKILSAQEGDEFINMWDDLYDHSDIFLGDGLHLSGIGYVRFCRLLSYKVFNFRQKRSTACSRRFAVSSSSTEKRKVIRCCMLNARGKRKRFLDLETLAASEDYHINGVSESWLDIENRDFIAEYN